jgi:hypothetical protein
VFFGDQASGNKGAGHGAGVPGIEGDGLAAVDQGGERPMGRRVARRCMGWPQAGQRTLAIPHFLKRGREFA